MENESSSDNKIINGFPSTSISSKTESNSNVDQELISRWKILQENLRSQVISQDTERWQEDLSLKLVAGMDISYPVPEPEQNIDNTEDHHQDESIIGGLDNNLAVACVVICSVAPTIKMECCLVEQIQLDEPYVPGFLAFRESEPLVKLLNKIIATNPNLKPDLIVVDGNGLLHPRRFGCACQIGLSTGIPTIGVAKNIYKMEHLNYDKVMRKDLINVGDFIRIKQNEDILGAALKTGKDSLNPVFVSVGHKISLETAVQVTSKLCTYRVPEPIRLADFHSREALRQLKAPPQPSPKKSNKTKKVESSD